jgi:hypothetical protein
VIPNESRFDHVKGAAADDLDLIVSPKDGKLVGVAQLDGVHVCWQCFEQFIDDPSHPHRPVEFNPGGEGTRFLVHSCCVKAASKALRKLVDSGVPADTLFWDVVKGHQMRRFLTKATKPFRKP